MPESPRGTVVFVTNNLHKAEEIERILSLYHISLTVSNVRKCEIQSDDIEEIAVESALRAYQTLRKPLFVEDSGLYIRVLNGFPGPYSSYVYRTIGVAGVLKLLSDQATREAEFISQIAYVNQSGMLKLCRGSSLGRIAEEARGCGGFGFDPIFIPNGAEKTFAEMTLEEKNRCSHRAKAAHLLASKILEDCASGDYSP